MTGFYVLFKRRNKRCDKKNVLNEHSFCLICFEEKVWKIEKTNMKKVWLA